MALSQLGPWADPLPGSGLVEALTERIDQLNLNELSASALAVATLGLEDQRFWHRLNGELLANAGRLGPRHIADALLALATSQLCPIALLEELHAQAALQVGAFEPEEAVVAAWALCCLRLFEAVPALAARAREGGFLPNAAEARQLNQVALSLELDTLAVKARNALAPGLLEELRGFPAASLAGDGAAGASDALDEVLEALAKVGAESWTTAGEEEARGSYTIDVALRPPGAPGGRPGVALLLDATALAKAEGPRDPWLQLKLRHLSLLGWATEWMPARRWAAWGEEERRGFAEHIARAAQEPTAA